MKNKLIIIIIWIAVISCKDKCNPNDEINSGIIISKLDIALQNHNKDSACIRDQLTYETYFSKVNSKDLPKIDFIRNSILFYQTKTSGCAIFNRNVTVDSISKTVYYTIDRIHCKCFVIAMDVWSFSDNIVLVPRIDDNYKIQYKYNKTH